MKNLHLLPTDKPSRLFKDQDSIYNLHGIGVNQDIYITSDEEIKDCWVFNTLTNQVYFLQGFYGRQIVKKIILTTDTDLISDGVQAIEDSFLEWFVKNPSCEYVEVKKGKMKLNDDGEEYGFPDMSLYKIIIPKEELKETLEEAAEKYSLELLEAKTIEPHEKTWIKSMFIHIAKEQAETMYSEEDMRKAFYMGGKHIATEGKIYEQSPNFETWFEQFKKNRIWKKKF